MRGGDSGDETLGATRFRLSYHGHIEMKEYDNVDNYLSDVMMSDSCTPISRREYVTRTIDHDAALSRFMESVDFREDSQAQHFEESVRATMQIDMEFLTHAMCHHAHNVHLANGGEMPVYVSPKMLRVKDIKAAMRKGVDDEDILSHFIDIGHIDLPNVCLMAYIRPDDDLARRDVRSEAVMHRDRGAPESESAIDNEQKKKLKPAVHGRKPFEKALGIDTDAFVHMTDFAVWPEDVGYDSHMASENAGRMYVVDEYERIHENDEHSRSAAVDKDEDDATTSAGASKRFVTRTWWNSALHPIGPAGECVLYVNPSFESDVASSNLVSSQTQRRRRRHDRRRDHQSNSLVEIYRTSALVPRHRNRNVVYGSRVWRTGLLSHDIVLNTTLPKALVDVNDTDGFVYDGDNSLRISTLFETLEKQAESQIVLQLLNGEWDIFEEIQRGMRYKGGVENEKEHENTMNSAGAQDD